jgi:hypothetical protein
MSIIHWIINYWQQVINPTTTAYGFWSGFGSDIGEVTLIAAVYHLFAVSRCHQGGNGFRGCRRHGKYDFFDPATNTTYKLCGKHHPSAHPHLSLARIAEIHKQKHADDYER